MNFQDQAIKNEEQKSEAKDGKKGGYCSDDTDSLEESSLRGKSMSNVKENVTLTSSACLKGMIEVLIDSRTQTAKLAKNMSLPIKMQRDIETVELSDLEEDEPTPTPQTIDSVFRDIFDKCGVACYDDLEFPDKVDVSNSAREVIILNKMAQKYWSKSNQMKVKMSRFLDKEISGLKSMIKDKEEQSKKPWDKSPMSGVNGKGSDTNPSDSAQQTQGMGPIINNLTFLIQPNDQWKQSM